MEITVTKEEAFMYGTIARVRVKPEMKEALQRAMAEDHAADIPGWIADYLFESTTEPQVCFLVAFFKDEASYTANADSPAQHESYLKFRACWRRTRNGTTARSSPPRGREPTRPEMLRKRRPCLN